MARTAIQPVDMADPRPRYTHGWRVGNSVYVAGQLALDKDGNLVGPTSALRAAASSRTCAASSKPLAPASGMS
jgi:enamine deaminase RidA (YjgF/YER057c/UK114 family)